MTLPYPPPFQDLKTLAEHLCAGESTVEQWVKMGYLPRPKLVGGKRLWEWKKVVKRLATGDEEEAASAAQQLEDITNATRALKN